MTVGQLFLQPKSDRPILLLLDEVDSLIKSDRQDGNRLFTELRGLHRDRVPDPW